MQSIRKKDKEYCIFHEKHIEGHEKRTCPKCKIIYNRNWRKTLKGINYSHEYYHKKNAGTIPEKARSKVSIAVRRGDILPAKRFNCVDCGKEAKVYDHRDYLKPLDIVPVCLSCNKKRGQGLNNAK